MKTEYLNNSFLEATISLFQKSKQEKIRFGLIIEDLKGSVAKCSKHKKKMPVDELNFFLMEFERASKEHRTAQDELTKSFYLLTERLIRYAKDIIVDPDDALQEGVLNCFEKVDRFDPRRGSKAFNYMTTCIINHFRQMYRGHKNQKLLKERYAEFLSNKYGTTMIKNRREINVKDLNMD